MRSLRFLRVTINKSPYSATSVFLPSMTLPPSPTLPIFTSAAPSSSPLPSSSNHSTLVAEAAGITIGLAVGLTAFAVLGYLFWRRRQRRRPQEDDENEVTARPSPPLPSGQPQAMTTVSELGRARAF